MRLSLTLICAALLCVQAQAEIRWFNLATEDVARAANFYSALFGWRTVVTPSGGRICLVGDVPIGGISSISENDPDADESQWIPGILVDEVTASRAAAVQLGAKVEIDVTTEPEWGTFALITDPEGAPFIVATLERNIGGLTTAGTWVWADLWAKDTAKAAAFYGQVLGFETDGPAEALYFTARDTAEASLIQITDDEIEQSWAPYIGVASLEETLQQAEALGGEVLLKPDTEFREGKAALVADPTGAAFFVFELEAQYL